MAQKIRIRRDTGANWNTANPVLLDGEMGFDKTSKRYKTGEGSTAWNALPYDKINYSDINDPPLPVDTSNFATNAALAAAIEPLPTVGEVNTQIDVKISASDLVTIDGGNAAFA